MASESRVLFICTGNFYRSRFAEALFNHLAIKEGLPWRAFSRGLAIHWAEGDISPFTKAALKKRGIDLSMTGETRVSLTLEDLASADRVIALKKAEHHAMMIEQFPDWAERIEYWGVHDLDVWTADQAIPSIEEQVKAMVETIAESR